MRTILTTTALVAGIFILGLTAAFAQETIPSGPKPAWVDSPPADTDAAMYFVGSGSSSQANMQEAQLFAIDDILGQIVRFLDVKITTATSTAAVGDLDEFKTAISRQVTETSGARMTGFRVTGKWSEKSGRGVSVSVLVSYEKAALLAEKKRLEEVFQATINAVKIPEAEGEKLAAAGAYYEAACRFIEAASAAAESTLEDSAVALTRTLARAMDALEKINLLKLNDNLAAFAGEQPAEAFSLKVAAAPETAARGIPRAAVRITYYESKGGTDAAAKTVVMQSDGNGLIAFRHPALTFAGKGKVEMLLDLSAYLEKLKKAEQKAPDKVTALRKLALTKRQEFQFTAASRVKDLLLAVFVVDMDENGKPYARNQTTAGAISESLTQQGFKLKTAALDPALAADAAEAELSIQILKKVPGAVRAVVGTAAVESETNDGGRFAVRVTGNVKVIDLVTKKVLLQQNLMKSSTGATMESARAGAFKLLGREFGARIAADAK
jgi:hypothetical protein